MSITEKAVFWTLTSAFLIVPLGILGILEFLNTLTKPEWMPLRLWAVCTPLSVMAFVSVVVIAEWFIIGKKYAQYLHGDKEREQGKK